MAPSVVLMVVGSALAHATWNSLLKRARDPESAVVAMMTVAALVALLIAAALRTPVPSPKVLGFIAAAGLLEAGYFVALARALSRAPLGSVYTVVRGGALAVVWPVSLMFLGESVTVERGLGALLVTGGLVATSIAERRASASATPAVVPGAVTAGVAKGLRSGIFVAAICALFVAGYHLAYKLALSSGGRPEAVNSLSLTIAVILSWIVLSSSRRRRVLRGAREEPIRIVIGGVLGALGFLVFLFAMKSAGAGVVLTLRNVSILFAQAMGYAHGERPARLGWLGVALVTSGAFLLTRT